MQEHTLTDQWAIDSVRFLQATLIDWKFPGHLAQLFRVPLKCPQHGHRWKPKLKICISVAQIVCTGSKLTQWLV